MVLGAQERERLLDDKREDDGQWKDVAVSCELRVWWRWRSPNLVKSILSLTFYTTSYPPSLLIEHLNSRRRGGSSILSPLAFYTCTFHARTSRSTIAQNEDRSEQHRRSFSPPICGSRSAVYQLRKLSVIWASYYTIL
jgi:hypothetical protein